LKRIGRGKTEYFARGSRKKKNGGTSIGRRKTPSHPRVTLGGGNRLTGGEKKEVDQTGNIPICVEGVVDSLENTIAGKKRKDGDRFFGAWTMKKKGSASITKQNEGIE